MKSIKYISLILVIALAMGVLALSASAQNIGREDTVIFDIDGQTGPYADPTNFNWMIPGGLRNQGMHQSVWEPLFILNYETGAIDPWLGVSFTSNESLDVWTLVLREGIKWQDGEDFNADDVVFTIQMLLDDETQTLNDAANMQQWVDSVEKVDDLTVQFNLKEPNPRFQLDYFSVRIWGGISIMPEHIWAGQDPFTFTFYDPEQGWPIGTGAYKLVDASDTEFTYERDDNWWGAATGWMELPEPLRLVWTVTGTEETRALLMSEGEIDSLMDVTLGAFEAIQARNPNVIAWFDDLPYVWFDPCPRQMSVNYTVAPWDDVNLRTALSLIMDRNQIVEVAYEGSTIPSRTVFVDYTGMAPFIDPMCEAGLCFDASADVAAGQALIEGAGYTLNGDGLYERDGEVLSLDIQTHEGFIEKRRIAAVLVEQLRAAGIDASTRAVAGSTWEDAKAFGDFEAVLDWDACGSINEPWNSMNRYTVQFNTPIGERAPGNNDFMRWSGADAEAYSDIVAQIGVLPLGDPAIPDMVVEAMTIWTRNMPSIPITQARKLVPFNTEYWTGWPTATNNYNHPATWWQSTHQIIHNLTHAGM